MKVVLVTYAQSNEDWFNGFVDQYIKKISHLTPFERVVLSSKKAPRGSSDQKEKFETQALKDFLNKDDLLVLFDEKGKSFTSEQFSKNLESLFNMGKKRLVFAIGGAYGFSEEIKKLANQKISLAPFVMNHLVAEAVALEQVYRAMTIKLGLPYHNK